jgi:hypothetical protein
MKRPIALLAVAFASLSLAAVAAADPSGHGKGHQRGHDTARHGKLTFTFATTDNGSCGTAWHHQSLFFRHWQDKGTGAGTSLAEHFKGDIADA